MFGGSITALITPFKNGDVDLKAFADFVEWQVSSGTHGVVPCGTTGEAPTLDDDEYKAIFDCTVSVVKGRIPVIAGTGANSTRKAVMLTRMAAESGADAALVVVPYYNKPTQEGIYAHFKAIHDSTDLPIVMYNVPSRCGTEISVDTVLNLSELPRIVGLKDATNDVGRTTQIKAIAKPGFCVLSGEDALAGAFLAQGGDGCISVTSNVVPRKCAEFQTAWVEGDMNSFQSIQAQLAPLHKALFVETSPAPVKYVANLLEVAGGAIRNELRLPLVPASAQAQRVIDIALQRAGLIDGAESGTLRRHG